MSNAETPVVCWDQTLGAWRLLLMDERELEKRLAAEGFGNIFVWRDGPNGSYPDHTHSKTTAHIILEGEMTIVSGGTTQTVKAGGRFDVPANAVHSATMGPKGCKYMVGEK